MLLISWRKKQRLVIAGALASDREIILLDESTSSLDFNSTQEVAQLAQERVICFASHGPEFYVVATDLILMINQQVKCNLQLILRREKRSLRSLDEF